MDENVCGVIKDILDANWNIANVAKPIIKVIWDVKRIDARQGDFIALYETASLTRDRGDITYTSEDVSAFVSIDIRTMRGETNLDALYTEVERIRKLKRRDPHADYHLLNFIRRTNICNKITRLFRYVVDVGLVRRKIII